MADRMGQQLGNYRLTRLLGRGGFAEVYLGEHIHLGTQAAVKVLHSQFASDELEKFRNEARTIARLEHRNIVRVFDFGVEDSTPFFIMTYAPNGTLRNHHPKGIPLPVFTIIHNVEYIVDALQYVHNQKLIHRDIKPQNILLGSKNEVLLSDFGLALIAHSSRRQGTRDMAGTISYMAPEQLRGKPCLASDQYALGVVVYEWLSGDLPFHGSFDEIAGQHILTPPPSLHEKVPDISRAVEEVVMKALAKDPKERFATVLAFALALEQAIGSLRLFASAPLPNQHPTESSSELPGSLVSAQSDTLPAPSQSAAEGTTITPLSIPSPPSVPSTLPSRTSKQSSETSPSSRFYLLRQRLSRRAVVVGLLGITGLAALGGSLTLQAFSQKSQKLAPPTATPTLEITSSPTSEVTPLPTSTSTVQLSPNPTLTAQSRSTFTIQITVIPTQVSNNSVVPVNVNTSEPNVTVQLQVSYNAYPFFYQSKARVTDGDGNATLNWAVSVVKRSPAKMYTTRVVAVATDHNGQQAVSAAVTVQVLA